MARTLSPAKARRARARRGPAGTLSPADRLVARTRGVVASALLGLPDPVVRALAGAPPIRDGQQLDLRVALMLRLLRLSGESDLDELTVTQARRGVAADAYSVQGRRPEPVAAEPVEIPAQGGPVAGRLYTPAGAQAPNGLIVYFHGGGFVVGDLDTHDHLARYLALAAGARVLAVDYRRAPEHPFPAATQDAWAAVQYAATLGHGPLAVAGDSAGGNLAAGAAQQAARAGGPELALQLLIYPWLDLAERHPSHALFAEGFYLTTADLDWYADQYLARRQDAADPRCSPLRAEDLSGVAPAYVATAGFDPLRDEGEAYARRLREAGVPAVAHRHAGLVHGFANTLGAGPAGREAVLAAGGAVRLALAGAAR